jgi:hypothetical protein
MDSYISPYQKKEEERDPDGKLGVAKREKKSAKSKP